MAGNLNFRGALGGFNKEDVVNYLEYISSKHTHLVNQLTDEADELRRKLEASVDLAEQVAQLTARLEEANAKATELEQENERLKNENEQALAEIENLKNQQAEAAAVKVAAMELEAYRRAEQAERNAKIKAEQIYQQAVGTLAQATSQVDNAANQFRQVAEQVNGQLAQLQLAVDGSKNALMDAATTMYTIRPERTEI